MFIGQVAHKRSIVIKRHLFVFFDSYNIDDYMCIELPEKEKDEQYEVVSNHMMHGLCDPMQCIAPSIGKGKCVKLFLKS